MLRWKICAIDFVRCLYTLWRPTKSGSRTVYPERSRRTAPSRRLFTLRRLDKVEEPKGLTPHAAKGSRYSSRCPFPHASRVTQADSLCPPSFSSFSQLQKALTLWSAGALLPPGSARSLLQSFFKSKIRDSKSSPNTCRPVQAPHARASGARMPAQWHTPPDASLPGFSSGTLSSGGREARDSTRTGPSPQRLLRLARRPCYDGVSREAMMLVVCAQTL